MAGKIRSMPPIRAAASKRVASDLPKLGKFVPFDPATKMSQATAVNSSGVTVCAVKGAFTAVAGIAQAPLDASTTADQLEARGYRVLAVAVGPPEALKIAGIIALSDPPRADSAALITELQTLGVRTVMLTGDAPATAEIVALEIGLDGGVCPPGPTLVAAAVSHPSWTLPRSPCSSVSRLHKRACGATISQYYFPTAISLTPSPWRRWPVARLGAYPAIRSSWRAQWRGMGQMSRRQLSRVAAFGNAEPEKLSVEPRDRLSSRFPAAVR